jgi:hypothetical protein
VVVTAPRCLRCNAVFDAEGVWRPVNDGAPPAREYLFRGSVITKVVFLLYLALSLCTVLLAHYDTRGPSETWGGFLSFAAKIVVGLPTSLLVWRYHDPSWSRAAIEWLFWSPIVLNLLFFAWLAFPRRKSKHAV